MKILKILVGTIAALLVLAAILYPFRRDPIGMLAGKALSGVEVAYPASWDFSDAHDLIAVEVRPDDPHSVTTVCFVVDGALHVPAMNGSEKEWPSLAVADDRVRIKLGDEIYPARAVRVEPEDRAPYLAAMSKKYGRPGDAEPPPDVWLFRIEPRQG